MPSNDEYLVDHEDTFSDIENIDWPTIKSTLSSSDSWSICRLGDYFVKTGKSKRSRHEEQKSSGSGDEFDMLDDIYGNQPLFRLMPQPASSSAQHLQPIIEPGSSASHV